MSLSTARGGRSRWNANPELDVDLLGLRRLSGLLQWRRSPQVRRRGSLVN